MPNIKSQIKRVKTNQKENLRNKAIKSSLKTSLKKADAALLTEQDKVKVVSTAFAAIDTAAKKGVIHKNTAARKKAAFAKKAAV